MPRMRLEPLLAKALVAGSLGLLPVFPVLATPNWMQLGETERAAIYIDTVEVERPPNYLKLWTLVDYQGLQRGGWLSEKRLFLYSCTEQTLLWQQSMYYALHMAEGAPVKMRSLRRSGGAPEVPGEYDPAHKADYQQAVPESAYIAMFAAWCQP